MQDVRAEALCRTCGTVLRSHWTEDGQDWLPWRDADGSEVGGRVETWEDFLARLAREDVAGYSLYSAVRVLGGALMPGEHLHAPDTREAVTGQIPECCGWPMRRTRDDWRCRNCEVRHTFA